MIAQGLVLTVVGMTVVFLFLALLVILMNILSGVILRYFPEPEKVVESSGSGNAEIAAVIAAVKAYIS